MLPASQPLSRILMPYFCFEEFCTWMVSMPASLTNLRSHLITFLFPHFGLPQVQTYGNILSVPSLILFFYIWTQLFTNFFYSFLFCFTTMNYPSYSWIFISSKNSNWKGCSYLSTPDRKPCSKKNKRAISEPPQWKIFLFTDSEPGFLTFLLSQTPLAIWWSQWTPLHVII